VSDINSYRLDRRNFLKGVAGTTAVAAAGTGLLSGTPSLASSPTLTLGDAEISVFSDGTLSLPMNFILPDRSEEEIKELLSPHGLSTETLTPDCNVTLMRRGDRLVLFDVGSGANFMSSAGQLLANLEDAGIDPGDVTDVIFTHAHPDHLWGVLDDFDDPLFYEAQYWVPQGEWDFWMDANTLENMPDERKSFVVGAQSRFEAIADQVEMVPPGTEVVPGVEAVDTAGHTPGHMSYVIHGGSESAMVIGDAISNAVISFEKLGWNSGSDHDTAQGIQTRKALLDRLAADKTRLIGYHLPHPGHGYAERNGDAYKFVAG